MSLCPSTALEMDALRNAVNTKIAAYRWEVEND
jgi:hypothetical protein